METDFYKQFALYRQVTIIHLDIPSIIIHQDSEEGKAQIERDRKKMEEARRFSVIDKTELTEEASEKEKRRKKVCNSMNILFTQLIICRKFSVKLYFWRTC